MQKIEDFEMKTDVYRYSDSENRFSGKFYDDYVSDICFKCYGLVRARSEQHERERSETLVPERQLATRCSRLALLQRAANYNARDGSRTHFKRVRRAACKNFSPCILRGVKSLNKYQYKKPCNVRKSGGILFLHSPRS